MFRIYHPVAEGMILASCDTDKRNFLHKASCRDDGSPCHAPYLKKLEFPDPMHPDNRSTKAVWQFENVDRKIGTTVDWQAPLRIRHVSGKYLSVDTSQSWTPKPFKPGDYSWTNDSEITEGVRVFAAALIDEPDSRLSPGTLGSIESAVFTAVPNDSSTGTIPNSPTTMRICHEVKRGDGSVITCFMHHLPRPKSGISSPSSAEDDEKPTGGNHRKHGETVCFVDLKSPKGILRILPLDEEESRSIYTVAGFLTPLKLFSYLMVNGDDDVESGQKFPKAATDLVDATAGILLRVIQATIAGEAQLILKRTTQDWLKLATDNLPAKFSKLFAGEPSTSLQRIAKDFKLVDACFEVAVSAYNRYAKIGGDERSPFAPKKVPSNLSPEEIEQFENLDYMTRIPPQFIAKLAHVALQRLFAGERKNQGKLYALVYFVFPDFTKFFF